MFSNSKMIYHPGRSKTKRDYPEGMNDDQTNMAKFIKLEPLDRGLHEAQDLSS